MKKLFTLGLLAFGLTASAQQTSKIYVDMGTRGHDVSKSMYGMFFEEINHAGDGGLYAEMLQNRGFEEQDVPSGMTYRDGRVYTADNIQNYYGLDYPGAKWRTWNLEQLKYRGWNFKSSGITYTKDVTTPASPLNVNTPNALHLVLSNKRNDNGYLDVINLGYGDSMDPAVKGDGAINLTAGATYKLRFYLNTTNYIGSVKAKLCDASGNSVGEQDFTVTADGAWHEYTATLTASKTDTKGTFRLEFNQTGTIDVDYVSLFPTDTYKGRENGMRKDIAETLENLHPAFLRWPGGCIVEGIELENRVKWKETLGDPMQRRGEYSLWDYRSTYGFGYHEFLQFCEDMGMDGMFVGNVGMSCSLQTGQFIDPKDTTALKPYRQDIEDAIEYAIGTDTNNEWVKKRIEAGHPDPFPLKYVELGNENGTNRYADRFDFFYKYLKAKYPQITFINTLTWWDDLSHFDKTDMLDVHWYMTPDEFYNRANYFDQQTRGNYKIYAGEYAVNNNVGSGNMDAALAEAVFIGGMERNSDFVTMASYAPLLENVRRPSWACNLIWYDQSRVMGRASYYVQKMYSANRPDFNVKTRLYSDGQTLTTRGRIALGTWNTQAEFRNIKVYANTDTTTALYNSDFVKNTDEWTESSGTWKVTDDGTYAQTANGTPCVAVLNSYDFANSTIELEAKKTGGAEGFLIYLGLGNDNVNYGWRANIGGWGNTKTQFEQVEGGAGTAKGTSYPVRLENNKWYKIKLVGEEGKSLKCYIDGKMAAEVDLPDVVNGRLQAYGGYDKTKGEIVMKVVNGTEQEMTADIVLNATNIASTGTVETLSASSLSEENSLDNPTKISPVESTFNGFADKFTYTFKPCSFTIFRVKADSTAASALNIPAYDWNTTPTYLGQADSMRAVAKAALATLIKKAQAVYVDGAKGASELHSGITTAVNAQNAGTIKQLNTSISELQTVLDTYTKNLMSADNEQTSKLSNPNFKTMSNAGWLGDKPELENNVGEFFNRTFNTYQDITGLTPGTYLAYIQGFYRDGGQPEALAKHGNGTENLQAKFYANDSIMSVGSLYDYTSTEGYNGIYPDNRYQANIGFNQGDGYYANYLITTVGNDGKLRIGLRKETSTVWDWTCFNNLRIFYIPVTATGINSVKNEEGRVMNSPAYNLLGQRVDESCNAPIIIKNGKKYLNKR